MGKTAVTNGVEVALEAGKIKVLAISLGAAGFGGLSLLNSLFGSLGTLISWGLTSSTADLLRKASNREEKDSVAQDCARFSLILIVISFPLSILWLAVSKYTFAAYLTWRETALLALLLPVPVLMAFARGYLVGSGTTNQVLALRMLTPMLVLLCVTWAYGSSLISSPIEAFALTLLPAGFVAVWLIFGVLRQAVAHPRLPSRNISRKLLVLGAAFTASSFLQEGGGLLVKSWMAHLSDAGVVQVGLYAAAVAICSLPTRVAQSYFGIYRARLMSSAVSNPSDLSYQLVRSMWIIAAVGAVFSFAVYLFSGFIISTFMTKDFIAAKPLLEAILPTIPLRVITVPFVYKRFITGRYTSGLTVEVLGMAGMVAGTLLFYNPSHPLTIVSGHWIGAILPLLAMATFIVVDKSSK